MSLVCDICKTRPATARITFVRNGTPRVLDVCEVDYAKLQAQSPFEMLFSDSEPFSHEDAGRHESADIGQHLSDHAKELMQLAAKHAGDYGRAEIDTEHLLLALTSSDVINKILQQFKIKTEDITGYIEANAPREDKKVTNFGVSPRVKQVLAESFSVAQDMGHGYIGPEHLLISLAEEDDGLAGDLMRKYGLSPQALRQKTVRVVGKGAKEGKVEAQTTTPNLDKYSRDLSILAKQGKLDPVIGRSMEIETAIEVLSRRTKNNPVLIGEPGVGKTAIVEGLAQRIMSGDVPETLQDKRVVEVNLNSIVAGSKYRGEFEERLKTVIDEIVANQDELLVFVDELHTIVGAGANEGGLDASNTIKPSLARGELHLIGATTLNEYQKYIEKDAALERRFQPVIVKEPSVEQSIQIMRGLRDKYEAHHKVKITDEAITAAAELSDRYITHRFLPDKAIDLIDQAAARVRIAGSTQTKEVRGFEDAIGRLKREEEYALSHRQYEQASSLAAQVAEATSKRDAALDAWRKVRGVSSSEVTVQDIAQVVSKLTGVPVTQLTEEEKQSLLKLEERLHERVIGQEQAISAVSDAVRMSRAGLSPKKSPTATFLFLGPTGVGKTELAKALAETVFGDESAIIRIDMSEYMERHAVARMIGSPPGYVGFEEGGQLTEAVRRKPYSVVLLDEIEKAHPDVYNVLLQLLDEGRLTDGKGRVVDFSNTVIIATSNVGSELYDSNGAIGFATHEGKREDDMDTRLMDELKAHFRPEFINRLDDIIIFHHLDKDDIKKIVTLQLEKVARLAHGQDIKIIFDDSVVDRMAEVGYAPEFGARELRRKIKQEIENPLAKKILDGSVISGKKYEAAWEGTSGMTFKKA